MAPYSADLLLMRAQAHFALRRYSDAVADSGLALRASSGLMSALSLRARSYYALGELPMALKHVKEGLRQDPEHTELKKMHRLVKRMDRARTGAAAAAERGDWAAAEAGYRAALPLDAAHEMFVMEMQLGVCVALRHLGKPSDTLTESRWCWLSRRRARTWCRASSVRPRTCSAARCSCSWRRGTTLSASLTRHTRHIPATAR